MAERGIYTSSWYVENELRRAESLLDRTKPELALAHLRNAIANLDLLEDIDKALLLLRRVETEIGASKLAFVSELRHEAEDVRKRFASTESATPRFFLRERIRTLIELTPTEDPRTRLAAAQDAADRYRDSRDVLDLAYDQGVAAARGMDLAPLRDHQQQLQRDLKVFAVQLLTSGGRVVQIDRDAVPLVASAIEAKQLPLGTASDPARTEELANDALLAHANVISRMEPPHRESFLAIFRIAFLLGVAQHYAETLGLETLKA
jgi:hypothetical protein